MNTLQFYKDAVARKHGYEDWQDVIILIDFGELDGDKVQAFTDQAATLYAEEACKEQKRIDADKARLLKHCGHTKKDTSLSSKLYIIGADILKIDEASILNAPLAVNTEKV